MLTLLMATLAGALTLIAAPPVAADVDDFHFASMHADYTLGLDADGHSTLTVIETFVAVFPDIDQNRGMRRTIPDAYNGQPLDPQLVSITDETGAARPAEVEDDDGTYSVTSRAPDFLHGEQTFVFTYTLENVTWRFDDTGDEFYWDVNGNDWRQRFDEVSVTLHLDPAVANAATGAQACYVGAFGATATCDIAAASEGEGAVVTAFAGPVDPYETVTIAVGFRDGTFELFDTGYLASVWGWLQLLAALGVLGGLVLAIVQRRRHLQDAPGRPVIIAEYAPPGPVDALESAVLLGQRARGIPAEVLEQAIVGSIRIVEGGRKFFGGVRLKAQLLDRSRADGDGRMLLDGLFGRTGVPGAEYEFGSSDRRFSTAAQRILKAADREITARGLRRTVPWGARALPIAVTVGAAAFAVLFGVLALAGYVASPAPILVLLGAALGVVLVVLLVSRRPLSAAGAEVRDHLRGLEMFIRWAEADRIRMLQSPAGAERRAIDTADRTQMLHLYEALLPYAVVFRQEKQWARELTVLYGAGATPYWYYGTHGFDASSFSAGIGTLSTAAAASSSTSGGSSGGGSAGGGGGGGGGGGV